MSSTVIVRATAAIDQSDHDTLDGLIRYDSLNVNESVNANDTLLLYAVNKCMECTRVLIEHQCNINQLNRLRTETALHRCAKLDDSCFTLQLLASGALLSVKNAQGLIPLDVATKNGRFHQVTEYAKRSDLPLILLRDSLNSNNVDLLESAIDLGVRFPQFKYKSMDAISLAIHLELNHYFIIRMVESGALNNIPERRKIHIFKLLKEGYGTPETRKLFRYGIFSSILKDSI